MARDLHVEVNAFNIDFYELDKLTGNSKEDLLARANESLEHGVTLFCKIPDPVAATERNVFDAFNAEKAPDVEQPAESDISVEVETDEDGNARRMDDEGVEIVTGEIVDIKENE